MAGKEPEDFTERSPSPDDNLGMNINDGPDIAINNQSERPSRPNYPDNISSVLDNPPRREENPFSFKRFLNQDRGGVRRKEYSPDGAPILHNSSEISSVLPDFVQDHLVVEQCYLNSQQHHNPLPFDLPLPDERSDTMPKSLPDFLSDGPIRSQRAEAESASYMSSGSISNGLGSMAPPRNEQERLQREVDSLRRQLMDRTRRVEILESEMALMNSRDARETTSLEQALQQVESNLRQTSKRMTSAEATVAKLKAENRMLKSELQASREDRPGTSRVQHVVRNQRLAQDLRGAASAAEVHLRALMSGIDNLRLLASTVEDRTEILEFDDCEDGATGPAL